MDEVKRNESLLLLVNDLLKKDMTDSIIHVGNILKTDTIAMKKTFSIIARSSTDWRVLDICVDFEKDIRTEIGEEYYKGKKPDVVLQCMCEGCKVSWIGPEPQMCCSGRDCGCMGLPTEPVVCSEECYDKMVNRYK